MLRFKLIHLKKVNRILFYYIFTFLLGFGIGSYLSLDWILTFVFERGFNEQYYPLTQRPLFYFSLMFIIVGTQLFLAGFVAELLVRNSSSANKYDIEKKLKKVLEKC